MTCQVAGVYSMKRIVDLECFVDITIGQLLERINMEIESQPQNGEELKANILLNEYMGFFASDAVGELAVCSFLLFFSSLRVRC